MYSPSSTFGNGKPIGFQRWVNADNNSGSDRKMKYRGNISID
jgi:hypothetical protein